MSWRTLLLVPLLAAGACDGDDDRGACTDEFRTATVYLKDANDAPANDVTVATYLVRTGELVPITSLADLAPGNRVVLDDGAVPLIEGASEEFRLEVRREGAAPLDVLYRFSAPSGCHIEKVSGPDTVEVP